MIIPSAIMSRLIYVSHVAPSSETDMDSVLSEILTYALPRNRRLGITGLLMTHRGWFIQVLEGSAEAVHEVFNVVREDRRHQQLRVISESDECERIAPRWSLATRVLSTDDAAVLRSFDLGALSERTVLRLAAVVSKAHQARFDAQQKVTSPDRREPATLGHA